MPALLKNQWLKIWFNQNYFGWIKPDLPLKNCSLNLVLIAKRLPCLRCFGAKPRVLCEYLNRTS